MRRPTWILVATVFFSVLILAVVGALYTNHAISVEDAKVRQAIATEGRIQCGIYTLLDGNYQHTPPTTPAGKQFAAIIHQVVLDLGC